MAFVRTVTFSLPRDEAEMIKPGNSAYTTLVPGRKYVAQTQSGLIQTSVWRTVNPSGAVQFVIHTEWSTIEDMQAYASTPVIKEIEKILGEDNNSMQVSVYEVIG